jgi:hypothetical protein
MGEVRNETVEDKGKAPAKPEADPAASAAKGTEGGEDTKTRTVEVPAEEYAQMTADVEFLKGETERRTAEARRERGRTRAAREKSAAAGEGSPTPPTGQEVSAQDIADAILSRTQSRGDAVSIPGLRFSADGEATFQGRPIDPDVATMLIEFKQDGASQKQVIAGLVEKQAEYDERFNAADERERAIRAEATEQRHITRMENHGLAEFDAAVEHIDTGGLTKILKENFYARMSGVLAKLEDSGVAAHEVDYALIERISKPIIADLKTAIGKAEDDGQKAANDKAKEDEPARREGSAAEPGPPDDKDITPEQRKANVTELAKQLAKTHGVGSGAIDTARETRQAHGAARMDY